MRVDGTLKVDVRRRADAMYDVRALRTFGGGGGDWGVRSEKKGEKNKMRKKKKKS